MVLTAPEFIVAKLFQMLDKIEIAPELQEGILPDGMMRGEKSPEIQPRHCRFSRSFATRLTSARPYVSGQGYVPIGGHAMSPVVELLSNSCWSVGERHRI